MCVKVHTNKELLMTRRNFFKLIGVGVAVLALPLNAQNKILRRNIKERVVILDSYNIKNVYRTGVGQYTVEFIKPIGKPQAVQTSHGSVIVNSKQIEVHNHFNSQRIDLSSLTVNGCEAWVSFGTIEKGN